MKTFPEDIECILEPKNGKGGIFVSNIEVAENPSTLKKFGIGSVITAIKGKNLDKVIPKYIQYLYIPAVDSSTFDISYYFEDAYKFIDGQRQRTNILVHCMAGVSRSVSLVIAYLMKKFKTTFDQVFKYVKQKRKIIHPNQGFIQQLRNYEKKVLNDVQKNRVLEQSLNRNKSRIRENRMKNQQIKNYDQTLKQNIKMLFKQKGLHNSRCSSQNVNKKIL